MNIKSVFCVAVLQSQAENILDRLRFDGIENAEISVIFPNKVGASEAKPQEDTSEMYRSGSGKWGNRDDAADPLAWLEGVGMMVYPGVEPFLASGPVRAALREKGVDRIASALRMLGLSEYNARHYEADVKAGNILIGVCANSFRDADVAKEIFEESGGLHVTTARPTAAIPSRLRNTFAHMLPQEAY